LLRFVRNDGNSDRNLLQEAALSASDLDHLEPGPGIPLRHPLRTAAIVIYATLLLLALTIPRSLTNWVKGFEPNGVQSVALQAAEGLAAFSHRIGADWVFERGRELFLQATSKRED
jgi:hypothetical protein